VIASITGIGWVTPMSMGCGKNYKILTTEDGKPPKFTSRMIFGKILPRFGRLDNYSKLGFAAIAFALKDAQRDQWLRKRPIGIIISTVYGCLATDMDYYETVMPEGGTFASPNLFAYTLPNVFLGEVAIHFGLTGAAFVINEPGSSGIASLRMALNNLMLEECPIMLAGFCDAGRPEFFQYPVEVTPGAVFFVLEKTPGDETLSYGDLDMDNEGAIFFEGAVVQNQQTLLQRCIKV
jgi:3-oxoacyl-[acyl-carrier-protein] synthase II